MRPYMFGGLALLLVLGLSPGLVPTQAQETEPAPTPAAVAPQSEEVGPSCGDCHELAEPFKRNPHARGMVRNGTVPNGTCETCHGDGTAHIESGGDPTLIIKPIGREGGNICLSCHSVATGQKSYHTGVHANSAMVNCLSCHSVHHSDGRSARLLARPQQVLCANCHSTQTSSFRSKPYAHRLGRGGMECSSCHEPHGRPGGRENLRLNKAGESPCLSCHTNVRGPFVFAHGGAAIGDCSNCHEPHGSNNPKMLKRAQVWQVCIECHTHIHGNTLGSQPPAFHNLNLARYRNCTTCHTAVHGSNRSPMLLK
jgi:DmsE family decaheme c-type cytochrome